MSRVKGSGDYVGRTWRSDPIDLSVVNKGAVLDDIPQELRTFVFVFSGTTPAKGTVLLDFGRMDTGNQGLDAVTRGVDPVAVRRVMLERPTGQLFVFNTATAGATMRVYGFAGDASPLETAADIAAAIAAVTLTVGASPPTTVATTQNVNQNDTVSGGVSTTVLAANAARKRWSIRNIGDTAIHLNMAAGAATTDDKRLDPGEAYEQDGPFVYTGAVQVIDAAVPAVVPNVEIYEEQ